MRKKRAKKSEIFIKYSAALDDKIKTEKWFKLLERRICRQDQEQVKNEKRLFDICDESINSEEFQGKRFKNFFCPSVSDCNIFVTPDLNT